ncbi:AAA family ATPase [Micromonospora sagamiensis]|uniref:AAA domain-containing protein n=1 Tax=Micromonospora sagamiensis TaxID=47875 RepID=A0A562WIB3_9ACTN|nr:AAA family ATPase [Micromonospora sagamiensis]TWJ29637.1 AAA domain-containing protein [Micromonospora sagamiensis]BCL17331.1 hypothetical protein GCM10017556_50700 [Micromonospora sagamiensis]
MIIWLNGPFGAGKTTLSERLAALLPGSLVVDPEEVGFALRRLVPPPPTGDFQDLPIWRSLTLFTLREIRRLYGATLIVPMTLVVPAYLTEIVGGLVDGGEDVLHVWLDVDEPVLRSRITAQVIDPTDPVHDAEVRRWRLDQVDRCRAARPHLPAGTRFLDSGTTDPDTLAAEVTGWVTAGRHH